MLAESGYRICFLILCVMNPIYMLEYGSVLVGLASSEADFVRAVVIMFIVLCLVWVVYFALIHKMKGAFSLSYLYIIASLWSVIVFWAYCLDTTYLHGNDVTVPLNSGWVGLLWLVIAAGTFCVAAIPMVLGGMLIVRAMNERRNRTLADC